MFLILLNRNFDSAVVSQELSTRVDVFQIRIFVWHTREQMLCHHNKGYIFVVNRQSDNTVHQSDSNKKKEVTASHTS